MKKIVPLLLSIVLIVCILPQQKVLADDITGITLEKEMRTMIDLGVIKGYGKGKYAPGEKVTRGQFATFLARALQLPSGTHLFSDVSPASSLADGINAAVAANIVSGYSATIFKPNDLITRAQMALMINNALNYLNIEKQSGNLVFTDQDSITTSTLKSAILNMVGHKIISGYPDGDGFAFKPQQTATRAEAAAFISRMLDVKAAYYSGYQVGTLDSDGEMTVSTTKYKTFSEAKAAVTNAASQVILFEGDIVQMNSGIVLATPSNGNATTSIYNANMTSAFTYVQSGTELQYISSDENKVTIKVAGTLGYVKHDDVSLIPSQQMTGRSYYLVNSLGDLVHKIYNHTSKTYITYTVGKAPATFSQGVNYYSWDGASFTLENGKNVGTYYQYFNMLPLRTSTNYTVEELDKLLMNRLAEKEALYKKYPTTYARYKDATKKSKLIGLPAILKEFESEHKLNALLILSLAINESDYGMSMHAQTKNNLFGLSVFDSAPLDGAGFASIRECVTALSNDYLNKNYIPTTGYYANGGMFGNKARGINVKYASDAYWGQKNAGHAYMIDKELGGKDFGQYNLYETTSANVNVRASAGVASNSLYTYKKSGYPVAVVATEGSWHKILSDNRSDLYGYISSQYVQPMQIAK